MPQHNDCVSLDKQFDAKAAVVAGVAGGAVFIVTMKLEIRLSGRNLNDLVLLGRPVVRNPETAARAGLLMHGLSSAGLGALYATFARQLLPGPPAVRGALFATVENTLLYPVTALEGAHPAINDGQIDHYWSLRSYLWTVPRHLAYGLVLGSLYERLRDT